MAVPVELRSSRPFVTVAVPVNALFPVSVSALRPVFVKPEPATLSPMLLLIVSAEPAFAFAMIPLYPVETVFVPLSVTAPVCVSVSSPVVPEVVRFAPAPKLSAPEFVVFVPARLIVEVVPALREILLSIVVLP